MAGDTAEGPDGSSRRADADTVGAMPLTAYTAQIVIWAIVAAAVLGDTGDLVGFRELDPFWPLALSVLVASTAWALLIGRGPLEWILDTVSRAVARARR